MVYEVDDKKEIQRKLAELGVNDVGDVRRAHGSHHHDVPAVLQAERLSLQAYGSPGSMSVAVDNLLQVSREVEAVRDEVRDLLEKVRWLGGHQYDGWGPIAKRMEACVSDRAGPEVGAVYAVDSYLAELRDLDTVLTQTAAMYTSVERDGMDAIRRAARGDG